MKTRALLRKHQQGEGRGFWRGWGAFGPQPHQDSIPLSAQLVYEENSLTAETPTGLLREGQGGEAGSKSFWLPVGERASCPDRWRSQQVSQVLTAARPRCADDGVTYNP